MSNLQRSEAEKQPKDTLTSRHSTLGYPGLLTDPFQAISLKRASDLSATRDQILQKITVRYTEDLIVDQGRSS
jgi:hypothetical protein